MANVVFLPLNANHFQYIDVNPQQRTDLLIMVKGWGRVVEQHPGLEAWVGNVCMGAAGIVPIHAGRLSFAWALVSRHSGPYMRQITRQVRRAIDACPATRVEMVVHANFPMACKWAELLGLECETPTPLRKRSIDGQDEYVYARVR